MLGVGEQLRGVWFLAAVYADQIGAHVRRALIAVLGILGQRLEHHGIQLGGDVAMALRRAYRVLAHVLVGYRDWRVADERWLAGEHFVQHAAQ